MWQPVPASRTGRFFHTWTPCYVSSEPFLKLSITYLSSVPSLVFLSPSVSFLASNLMTLLALDLSGLALPSPWWGVSEDQSSRNDSSSFYYNALSRGGLFLTQARCSHTLELDTVIFSWRGSGELIQSTRGMQSQGSMWLAGAWLRLLP